jgi:predicted RNA-binding Zn-ribbon protein involved in translation (DUF1610 family)
MGRTDCGADVTALTHLECGNCGVVHAIPTSMYENCRREGGYWTCPNGHSRGWKDGAEKTEIANLRRERDRLVQSAAQKDDEIAAQAKQMKRLKKRAAAGTCPCCSRSFSNMSTHMRKQHPEFVAENVVRLKVAKS